MQLRVVRAVSLPGEVSMALDAACALRAGQGSDLTLRFYYFDRPTITVGRTMSLPLAGEMADERPGAALVRRPTGGGAVYHADQASFSLVWPRGYAPLRSLKHSYCLIHSCLAPALSSMDIDTRLVAARDAIPGAACSASLAPGDLLRTSDGRKIAGGGQWRSGGGVLYQGHIWLRSSGDLHTAVAESIASELGLSHAFAELTEADLEEAHGTSALYLVRPGTN